MTNELTTALEKVLGRRTVRFPLNLFFGMMGVAYADADGLTSPLASSIPPTLGGGNIDINALGIGSAFYLPVFTPGANFYVGDPHVARSRPPSRTATPLRRRATRGSPSACPTRTARAAGVHALIATADVR